MFLAINKETTYRWPHAVASSPRALAGATA